VLVGWSGADWKIIHRLVDEGKMPVTRRLVENGVAGSLTTLHPQVSPLLWTSIATGKRASSHRVNGFVEVDGASGLVQPVTADTRKSKAIWEILDEDGIRCNVIGWFASHGQRLRNGNLVSDMYPVPTGSPGQEWLPAASDTYDQADLVDALDPLRISPDEIDAESVSYFVPRWQEIDQSLDVRLARLRLYLAQAFSIQAATTWLMEHKAWDFTAVHFPTICDLCHIFLPYYRSETDHRLSFDLEVYGRAVEAGYELHDMMLGRLIGLAGPAATIFVLSDHGFRIDQSDWQPNARILRRSSKSYRQRGLFAAAGPGLMEDKLIHGGSLLDIVPTLLAFFGLPIGDDMEGKPLLQAFLVPPRIQSITSWETSNRQQPKSETQRLTPQQIRSWINYYSDLGYVDPIGLHGSVDAESVTIQNNWVLAMSLCDGKRWMDALPLLQEIYELFPENDDFAAVLTRCQMQLGLFNEATEMAEAALEMFSDESRSLTLNAQLQYELKDYESAYQFLKAARRLAPKNLSLLEQIGMTLVQLRRWDEAAQICRQVINLDANHALAWIGLAHAQLHSRRYSEAVDSALTAIGLEFGQPLAHYNLGMALIRLNELDRAADAFETALRFSPAFFAAHRWLQEIYRRRGQNEMAMVHANAWAGRAAHRTRHREHVEQLRLEYRERTIQRNRARQMTRQALRRTDRTRTL
jgi:tetratricopeptide (TPR) repeat protein